MNELETLIYNQFLRNCHQKVTAYNKKLDYEVKMKNMELESIKLKEVKLEIELKDIKVEEINRKVRHHFLVWPNVHCPFTFYYCF